MINKKTDKEINIIIMKKLKIYFKHIVSSEVWQGSQLEINNVIETFKKIFILKFSFPAEPIKTIKGTVNYEVPITWFDHLRKDYFPNFLNNKFPIKFEIIKINYEHEVGVLYPKFPITFPKQKILYYQEKK